MKYIRIENGVFAVNEEHGIKYIIFAKDYLTKYFVDSRHIIAEAKTIEGLCDVFIKKSKEPNNNYLKIGEDFFHICDIKYEKYDLEHYDYYGAIWTSKGLIYVAKMNSKGELELI